jgi:hypothetical protein
VGAEPVTSLSVLFFRSYSGGSGERFAAFIVRTKTKTKMPTGVQIRALAAAGDRWCGFDPVLWELDRRGMF